MDEIWADIPHYEGHYQVSNLGRVKSLYYRNNNSFIPNREKILKQLDANGYKRVRLFEKGIHNQFSVHRLVAQVFIPNPENKPCINHIDGNKENNKVDNLEWCTYSENEQHSRKVLGKEPINRKKVNQYDLKDNFLKQFKSLAEAGRSINKNYTLISSCCNGNIKTAYGYKWKFVKESD